MYSDVPLPATRFATLSSYYPLTYRWTRIGECSLFLEWAPEFHHSVHLHGVSDMLCHRVLRDVHSPVELVHAALFVCDAALCLKIKVWNFDGGLREGEA